jgi:predicted nucleotide-binding protein
MGEHVLTSLLKLAREVQGAAFVFREDDWVRRGGLDAKKSIPHVDAKTRDNVILEYGLFAGILGPENCAVFVVNGTKPPSDLLGVNYISVIDVPRAQAETKIWALSLKERALRWSQNLNLDQVKLVIRTLKEAGIARAAIYEIMKRLEISPLAVDAALDD